jgi:hypothetical protein
MLRYILRFLAHTDRPVPLGRWGYHFNKQRVYQVYYE